MSPVEPDLAFNCMLVKIIEITDYFYYSKVIFTDSKGCFYLKKLLLPIGNIAGLIEANEKEFERLESAIIDKSSVKTVKTENTENNVIRLSQKKENK